MVGGELSVNSLEYCEYFLLMINNKKKESWLHEHLCRLEVIVKNKKIKNGVGFVLSTTMLHQCTGEVLFDFSNPGSARRKGRTLPRCCPG